MVSRAETWGVRLGMTRTLEGLLSSQSALLALEKELHATQTEHWTPVLLVARTMREDSLASSHDCTRFWAVKTTQEGPAQYPSLSSI